MSCVQASSPHGSVHMGQVERGEGKREETEEREEREERGEGGWQGRGYDRR